MVGIGFRTVVMSPYHVLTMTALLVLSLVAVPMAGAQATLGPASAAEPTMITPGERLGGVLGVVDAELRGDLEERRLAVSYAASDTDETRARVSADSLDAAENRLAALEERRAVLEDRYQRGAVREGRYHAELARLHVEADHLERSLTTIGERSDRLPSERLAERNVDADRIDELRDRARTLSGPETADSARTIVGDRPSGIDHRLTVAQTALDRADERVTTVASQLDDDAEAARVIERARAELADGSEALERARAATATGDDRTASMLAATAIAHARNAEALASRALSMSDASPSSAELRSERAITSASTAVADAQAVVDRTWGYRGVGDNPTAIPYLERADGAIADAQSAVADARRAHDAGEYRSAIRFATSASAHAGIAEAYAERAMAVAFDRPDHNDTDVRELVKRAGTATATAATFVDRADRVTDSGDADAMAALERAHTALDAARSSLADARRALTRGDHAGATAAAQTAIDHAESAQSAALYAIERAESNADRSALQHATDTTPDRR